MKRNLRPGSRRSSAPSARKLKAGVSNTGGNHSTKAKANHGGKAEFQRFVPSREFSGPAEMRALPFECRALRKKQMSG